MNAPFYPLFLFLFFIIPIFLCNCEESSLTCEDKWVLICSGDQWKQKQNCEQIQKTCDMGHCVAFVDGDFDNEATSEIDADDDSIAENEVLTESDLTDFTDISETHDKEFPPDCDIDSPQEMDQDIADTPSEQEIQEIAEFLDSTDGHEELLTDDVGAEWLD